jgi:Cutinase
VIFRTAFVCLALLCGAAATLGARAADRASAARAGWAPNEEWSVRPGQQPAEQLKADARYARRNCASNTLLLYRVRGSGAHPGLDNFGKDPRGDKLGEWMWGLGTAAIAKGWQVRDLQADYPAPTVPLVKSFVDVLANGSRSNGAAALASDAVDLYRTWKRYRDVASKSWPKVAQTLVEAASFCRDRRIIVAGYSLGALVLRYVMPRLPTSVARQIVAVDLFGDPTEDPRVDKGFHHPIQAKGHVTDGVDTLISRVTHFGFFQQHPYPPELVRKTSQYCLSYDLVCDFNPVNIGAAITGHKAHDRYPFASVGREAAAILAHQ